MDDKNLHIEDLKRESKAFFSGGKIGWEKTEADVWAEIATEIKKAPAAKKVSMAARVAKYAAAAIVALLVGLGAVTFLYTKTVSSLPGEHLVAKLPDGSTVELNAGSTVEYHPLKWWFERKLKFEGEGYFEVKKGKKFEVGSENGTTRVLGTTFNIYARNNNYRVTCLTGLVKVTSLNNRSVLLHPNSHVAIEKGELIVKNSCKTNEVVAWKNNLFYFSGTPLKEVICEIERQYGVVIKLGNELGNRNFVGNFPKQKNVEEVLQFVCKPMVLKFKKQSEKAYLIVEKSE